MNSEKTFQIIKRWYDSLGRGDMDAVMGGLSEHVVFELPQDEHSKIIPYLGTHVGRSQVAEAFRIRAEENEILGYEIREVVAQGNVAFAVVYTRARYRPSGVVFEIEDAHRLVVDDNGQIMRWKVYFNPDPEVAAYEANLDERLVAAVGRNNVEEARSLLGVGANPNTRDVASGLTLLMMAAGQAKAELVALLLEHGADPHAADSRAGATALHKGCQGGSVEVCRLLLDAGAFVDSVAATTGHTPLMDAIWYKFPKVVQHLLDRGAGLNLATHYGFSLQQHVEYELQVNQHDQAPIRAARDMLEKRRASDAQQVRAQSLMAAVVRGDIEAVRTLLDEGAVVDARYPRLNGFNDQHTPLLVACREGRAEIVEALLRRGADVNAVEPVFGAVSLHKAVYNGRADVARMLARQPNIDLNYQGATNGYTPLHDALWHGFDECARVLIEAGARLDLRGHDGKRPLEIALQSFGDRSDGVVGLLKQRTPPA